MGRSWCWEFLVGGIHSQQNLSAASSHIPEAHIPLRSQAPAMARHSCVSAKSQAGWRLQGSTCLDARPPAPDPLLTNLSVELSKSMTHFPQCSSPDKLPNGFSLCPGEFLQPAGTSTTCSGQLHPAQTSPGCCPVSTLSLPSSSVCSGPEMCLSHLGLNSCSP